jgi:cathepsin D
MVAQRNLSIPISRIQLLLCRVCPLSKKISPYSNLVDSWASSASDDIAPGGQFTLGGRNTSLYTGDVSFVELTQQDYWTVPLTSIHIPSTTGGNGQTLTASGDEATAIIDSGSTIITGPTDMVDAFYAAIPDAVKGETVDRTLEGSWVVRTYNHSPRDKTLIKLTCIACDTNINAQFTFGSVTVTLPASVLKEAPINVTSRTSTQVCLGALVSSSTLAGGSSDGPAWIFGDSLLKGTYTVFRYGDPSTGEKPAVGFAKLAGVDYSGNGNEVIGSGGDGVDGRIGNAGVSAAVVTDTATGTVGTGPATVTDTTTRMTVGAASLRAGRSWGMGVLVGVGALVALW